MSDNNTFNQPKLKTIPNQRRIFNKKYLTLRQLQLSMLNSLSKSPIVKIKRGPLKTIEHDFSDFDHYMNKINNTLSKYQISFSSDKYPDLENENVLGPNEVYMEKEEKQLIKKVYNKNKLYNNKYFQSPNELSQLKVVVPEQQYPNPYQSLGIIKSNRHLYDEISKDFLFRQSDLFNQKIKDIQTYKKKIGSVKMPKINIAPSNNKDMFDIPIIDLTDKKPNENALSHILPQTDQLKLFAYYKYPKKNFPEGREQFSSFMNGNEIIISGGITSNMKNLTIWGLNLDKLEWKKIPTNVLATNRYGHTGTYFQNKIYFFGGKTKYQINSVTLGLEIFSFSDNKFTTPPNGKINPETRKSHIAELIGGQILIFGGINNSNEILNDCYLLNLTTLKWTQTIINRFTPGPKVYGHSSCAVIPYEILNSHKFNIYSYPVLEPGTENNLIKEKGIYIFGGKTKEEGGLSNELWILIIGKKPLEWVLPQTKGKPPSPRYFHSMSFYEKGNFLVVHGGRNDEMSENCALSDTYIFDLENFEWMKVELYSETRGFKVLSRMGHQSVIYSNKLIIIGGMNNNNYVGSSLMIVNLDFSYSSKPKSIQEILLKQLKDRDDIEAKKKLAKMKINLKKTHQLGVVTNISLPAIK